MLKRLDKQFIGMSIGKFFCCLEIKTKTNISLVRKGRRLSFDCDSNNSNEDKNNNKTFSGRSNDRLAESQNIIIDKKPFFWKKRTNSDKNM